MPSTITTYYSFQPATKARSSQVNTNFSNHRGDILPINENTASASDNSHYLGAPDHYFAGAYSRQINLYGATTTAQAVLKGTTSLTAGALELLIGSGTAAVWGPTYQKWKGATTTVDPILQVNQAVTTGSIELLFGSSTITTWTAGGLQKRSIDVGLYTTASAPIGGHLLAQTALSVGSLSTTGQTFCRTRLFTRGGGILNFKITNGFLLRASGGATQYRMVFDISRGATTTALSAIQSVNIVLPASAATTTASAVANLNIDILDSSYTAGEVVYQAVLLGHVDNSAGGTTISCSAWVFMKEM